MAKPVEKSIPKPVGVLTGERDGVRRISGDVAGGLYWSLRGAGASPTIAAEYLKAISTRIDVGEVAPFDRFDFAVGRGAGAAGHAALRRSRPRPVQRRPDSEVDRERPDRLVRREHRRPAGSRGPDGAGRRPDHLERSATASTRSCASRASTPGIDFGAAWGSPIVAAADGQVVGAGWSGGYGRQVRIVHDGGLMTTYSHMSAMVAQPGAAVRQGQVIGYVGSSGLSTGPHLHFEVRSRRPADQPADRAPRQPPGLRRPAARRVQGEAEAAHLDPDEASGVRGSRGRRHASRRRLGSISGSVAPGQRACEFPAAGLLESRGWRVRLRGMLYMRAGSSGRFGRPQ